MTGGVSGGFNYIVPYTNVDRVTPIDTDNKVDAQGRVDEKANKTGQVSPSECSTCESRRYVDGSNEMVSFKTPGKISPEESYSKVMSHEQEHVANARSEGSKPGKELISANVTLKMGICPECGTSYVAGGTTNTVMRTYKEGKYGENQKAYEADALKGNKIDYAA